MKTILLILLGVSLLIGCKADQSSSASAPPNPISISETITVPIVRETHSASWSTYMGADGKPLCQLEGQESRLNISYESSMGSDFREIVGGTLRAETHGAESVIDYASGEERIKVDIDSTGKVSISGNILISGQVVKINSETQKCTALRSKYDEDPVYELITFKCQDETLKLNLEALVPPYQQNSSKNSRPKYTSPPRR